MDIYCPVCGEPWEHDELHDAEGHTYAEASRLFRRVGCEVFGATHTRVRSVRRAELARVAYDVLEDFGG